MNHLRLSIGNKIVGQKALKTGEDTRVLKRLFDDNHEDLIFCRRVNGYVIDPRLDLGKFSFPEQIVQSPAKNERS
jgi:hypothetical protein